MSDAKTETITGTDPDARQADAPVGLFRKRYGKLTAAELAQHDKIKDAADILTNHIAALNPFVLCKLLVVPISSLPHDVSGGSAMLANKLYDAAGVTLAIRHIEDGVYRAIKALTA